MGVFDAVGLDAKQEVVRHGSSPFWFWFWVECSREMLARASSGDKLSGVVQGKFRVILGEIVTFSCHGRRLWTSISRKYPQQ
jgi:hypothetical protein